MEPTTTILGGIVIAVVSGAVGKACGTNNNVKAPTCTERQHACQELINEKIDNLGDKIDVLTRAVNSKLLGI